MKKVLYLFVMLFALSFVTTSCTDLDDNINETQEINEKDIPQQSTVDPNDDGTIITEDPDDDGEG